MEATDRLLNTWLAHMKITGIMEKSNEIARSMAQLMKVGQLQAISKQFSKELIKVRTTFVRCREWTHAYEHVLLLVL
jgi:hypothetical protein